MKYLGTALLGAAGILALSVTGASAAIVCNEDSDCWHVKQAYDYPPDVRVHVYGDDWKWADADTVETDPNAAAPVAASLVLAPPILSALWFAVASATFKEAVPNELVRQCNSRRKGEGGAKRWGRHQDGPDFGLRLIAD